MPDIAELLLVISSAGDGGTRVMGETQAGLAGLHAQADRTSGGLANLAGTLSKVGAAAIALGAVVGVASVKMAADFETKMTLVRTQAHDTTDNLQQMGAAVVKMSTEVGISADKLADGLYHVTSVGYRGADALNILKIAAEGARVGNADLDATTYALTSTMNTYGLKADAAASTMATLNAIVGAGDMRFQDLNAAISTGFLAAGETFGVSIQSMGAALAYLTDRGASADESATRLKMSINLLGAPTSKAAGILKDLGLSNEEVTTRTTAMEDALKKSGVTTSQLSDDLRKPDGIMVALTDLTDHMKKGGLTADETAATLSRAFGGGRSGAAIMSMVNHLDILGQKFDAVNNGASRFQKDWEDTQKTFNFQVDRMKTSVEAFAITLGARLLPLLTPIAKALADAAMSSSGWIQMLVNFATGFGLVLLALSGVAAVLPFLIGGFEILFGPVGLALALLAGAAYIIKENWGTIGPFFIGVANQIRGAFDRVTDGWNRLMSGGSGPQAVFQALTGIKPTAGGAGPQESGRTQRMNNAPSGGQVDFQESAAALRGNRGPAAPSPADLTMVRTTPAEAEAQMQRANRARPEEAHAAQQRAIGTPLGRPGETRMLRPGEGEPLGVTRGEYMGPTVPGAKPAGSLSGPAQIANTLGPLIDHAIDLFHRLSLAWNEVVRGFQNGASLTTVLIGVLMSLGVGGDKAVAMARALNDIWNRIASFVGPLLRNLLEQGIKPALADIQKNLGPLGREFSEAFVAWAPILRAIGVVLAFLIGVLFKSFIETLTVVLPIAVHIVIDILHVVALLFKTIADIIKGDWGALGWDLIHIGQFLIGEIVALFTWLWHQLVGGSIIPDMVNGIIGWFKGLATQVFNVVDGWVNSLVKRFGELKDGLLGMAKQIASGLIDFFGGGLNSVLGLFRGFLDALSKIPGVGALVPDANKVLGNIDLGALKKTIGLATGGMITNGPQYLVGEGNPAHPEVVLPTDPAHRGRALDLLGWFTKTIGLAGGGVMGNPYPPGECTTYVYCVSAGTLVDTERGQVPIEAVQPGDRAWTRQGLKAVLWSQLTRPDAEVVRIEAGETQLVCTPEHRVWAIHAPDVLEVLSDAPTPPRVAPPSWVPSSAHSVPAELEGWQFSPASHTATGGLDSPTETVVFPGASITTRSADPVLVPIDYDYHQVVAFERVVADAMGTVLAPQASRFGNFQHLHRTSPPSITQPGQYEVDELDDVPSLGDLPHELRFVVGLDLPFSGMHTPQSDDGRELADHIFVSAGQTDRSVDVGALAAAGVPESEVPLALKERSDCSDVGIGTLVVHQRDSFGVRGRAVAAVSPPPINPLHLTPIHRTWGWCEAADLQPGDQVLQFDQATHEFQPVTVDRIGPAPRVDTYDLTVEDAHEFVAGGLLVHNSRFPGMPVDGNATDWGTLPLQHSSTPAPGEIVVYHAGPGYSQYGHVAVVEEVLGDKFRVSEMNYVGHGVISSRISSMAGVETFLRPGVPGVGSPASGTSGGGFDIGALIDAALKSAQGGLNSIPTWIRGLAGNVLGKIGDAAKAKLLSFAGGTFSGAISGSHSDWLHAAEKAAGVGTDWDAGLSTIIQHESGWNPGARNNSDSNAQAGNASVGLMQLTGTNRARYDPDESPVGQIIGGIRYILARYGGINNVPGVRSVLHGGGYVPYDSGGMLMPGLTMALNNTGRPETVLPPGAELGGVSLAAKLDLTNQLLYQILHDSAPVSGYAATLRTGGGVR